MEAPSDGKTVTATLHPHDVVAALNTSTTLLKTLKAAESRLLPNAFMSLAHFLQSRKNENTGSPLSRTLLFSLLSLQEEPFGEAQQLQGVKSSSSDVQGDEEEKSPTKSEPNNNEGSGLPLPAGRRSGIYGPEGPSGASW